MEQRTWDILNYLARTSGLVSGDLEETHQIYIMHDCEFTSGK